MDKLKNIYNKTLAYLKSKAKNKTLIYAFGSIIILVILIGGFFGIKEIAKRWTIPVVSGANFSFEYKKIPFDVKNIEINFSTNLDEKSITKDTFSIVPYVEGKISLKNGNIINYELASKLQIGEQYTITIGKNVKSSYGVDIGKDYIYNIEAIGGAKVTKIIPKGNLQNISQNITAIFNIPIVPLTSLDNRDKLPCPLKISPEVKGKCKWISGNVLEFSPEKNFEGATNYSVKVENAPGLLYELKENFESKITTPDLTFYSDSKFAPRYGIFLRSNFPVKIEDLGKNIKLTKDGSEMALKIEALEGSDSRFIIKPKTGNFIYSSNYGISIKKGINPKFGNIPLKSEQNFSLKSNDFLNSVSVLQNVYSSSGEIVDTSDFTNDEDKLIPSKNVFFNLEFGEEVSLNKNLFAFKGAGISTDFNISYIKEEMILEGTNKKEIKENKRKLKLEIKGDLKTGTEYKLFIYKNANPSLNENVQKIFTVAPKLIISEFNGISNTENCVYFNNDILEQYDYYNIEAQNNNLNLIQTNPISVIKGFSKYYHSDYGLNICNKKAGFNAYLLNTRFNPFTDYTITIKAGLKDKYGNSLSSDFVKKIKTGDIKNNDKYLYASFNKDMNVIPSNLPMVINLQSINIDNANVEVCEMDINGYMHYLENRYKQYYSPNCTKSYNKNLKLKNKFWNLTNNKFDIEKDISGEKLNSGIILIRGTIDKFNRGEDSYRDFQREFINLLIRSNLSLTYEKAGNKEIIFATDYAGKEIPENLKFESYNSENRSN
ncbi:hypothetical protein KAZ01_02955, partial [Candidatus Gracilibacteria bacterium]|nr:hypothetical protein [Candidatus Gracilibacteria bacterium]